MLHPWDSQTFIIGARAEGRSEGTIKACVAAANAIKRVHHDLPVIFTLNHLAHLADVNSDFLQEVAHRQTDPYRVFRVKKRGVANKVRAPARRYRTICVPEPRLMRLQRWISQHILQVTPSHDASFAFTRDRGLKSAVSRHANAKWLVKMDVRRFFESITEESVYRVFRSFGYTALLSFQMARICTRRPEHRQRDRRGLVGRGDSRPYRWQVMGHLPQGAPTSPMLANRAVEKLDIYLETLANQSGWKYTRYADDLAFSRADSCTRGDAVKLVRLTGEALRWHGFEAHSQKTSINPPGSRKILLGVLIDRGQPKLTREFRNNIETHLYALNHPKVGVEKHREKRGFASTIGMRRHILGLIAHAHNIDPVFGQRLYEQANKVRW